jgi:hypothetical protein
MKNNTATELTVKCFFKEDGVDLVQILKESVLLFINREGEKLCQNA